METIEIFSDILSAQDENDLRAAMNRMDLDQKNRMLMAVYEVICQMEPEDSLMMVAPLAEEEKVDLLVGMFGELKKCR